MKGSGGAPRPKWRTPVLTCSQSQAVPIVSATLQCTQLYWISPDTQNDLKMMLLLLLCLLLPFSTALSKEVEGSVDDSDEEEDDTTIRPVDERTTIQVPNSGRNTGEEKSDQFVGIVVGVAVAMLALSVAVVIAILLVRRNMQRRQQGVYSVPADQEQKVSV
ncbi:unnamed protein product [Boreogadus saida]